MPMYQYRCEACEHEFSRRQRMSEEPVSDCPVCLSRGSTRRVISRVGILFKGSGFYVTDNRNGSGPQSVNGAGQNGTGDKAAEKGDPPAADSAAGTETTKAEKPAPSKGKDTVTAPAKAD